MTVRDEYPYCLDIIDSNYLPLHSSTAKAGLYVKTNNDRFVFDNPLLLAGAKKVAKRSSLQGLAMRTRDFLATIPAFSDFSDQQLISLEQRAHFCKFNTGDIIFRQGEDGDRFYVINKGSVDILVQDSPTFLARGDFGRVVNRLNEGCYFGERALVRSEPRAATIRVNQDLTCLAFSRDVYEEIISGSNTLVGQETTEDVDWSKDHETRSIFKHVESILEIEKMSASPKIKRILYELSTAFTPELSPDEIIARMVMTVKVALRVDRVGLFVLSEDKKTMVLKVSERSKGVRLPLRGLAGEVLRDNVAINIADAYKDSRFDSTMDKRTGYRTRQVLGVPLRHPLSGDAMGTLQVNNKLDKDSDAFSPEQQRVLELAAEQLSELLIGRADVFIHAGSVGAHRSYGQGVGDGLVLRNTSDLQVAFQMDISSITIGKKATEILTREGLSVIEVQVSLFLALNQLCPSQSVFLDVNSRSPTRTNGSENEMQFSLRDKLSFAIDIKDLPRASRIMFKIVGYKKKRGMNPTPQQASNNRVFFGWAACTAFDFKGCLECFQELKFFPSGEREIQVPINTTLSNRSDTSIASLSATLAPDVMLSEDMGTPRVRVVHTMPSRLEPFGDRASTDELNDPAHTMELERILKLSFNPMSHSIITESDKEFLWSMRYSIFNKAKLLPAFVMSVRWNKAEDVQELYDFLDLWEPATPVEALQLLDRRFMDPKVRAYAVHCLEELPDDELALYMLQLCQQLKFETFVDSALARFLLRRALTNQRLIGHIYFWLLQSELYNADVSQRYIILLQVNFFFFNNVRNYNRFCRFIFVTVENIVLNWDNKCLL
jgi:CRP-like cAMP-binding protein